MIQLRHIRGDQLISGGFVTGLILESVSIRHLRNVTATVNSGETVTVYGPSGGGKTSLLRAVADLESHTGRICLDGVEAAQVRPDQWRRQVMMVPAESRWWHPTVGDHFAAPPSDLLGLPEDILQWPTDRLSSGQRQRLTILRALSHRPRAMLLDEPTANMDPDSQARVESLLTSYQNDTGAPFLWVSHDPEQHLRMAERRLHVADGTVSIESRPWALSD